MHLNMKDIFCAVVMASRIVAINAYAWADADDDFGYATTPPPARKLQTYLTSSRSSLYARDAYAYADAYADAYYDEDDLWTAAMYRRDDWQTNPEKFLEKCNGDCVSTYPTHHSCKHAKYFGV